MGESLADKVVLICVKAAIPYLKANGAGKIITIGSGLGHHSRPKIQ
jgi:short-subunit dehydrogenase